VLEVLAVVVVVDHLLDLTLTILKYQELLVVLEL
jgi:hypothetical protein